MQSTKRFFVWTKGFLFNGNRPQGAHHLYKMITDYILEKIKCNGTWKLNPCQQEIPTWSIWKCLLGFIATFVGKCRVGRHPNDHPEDYAAQLRAHLLPNMDTAVPPKSVRTVDYSKAGTEVRHMAGKSWSLKEREEVEKCGAPNFIESGEHKPSMYEISTFIYRKFEPIGPLPFPDRKFKAFPDPWDECTV